MKREKVLITGANGQLGAELSRALQEIYGVKAVITSDIKTPQHESDTIFQLLDVTNPHELAQIVTQYNITQIYHLAAILSAKGEQNPQLAWQINMNGLLNVLNVSKEMGIRKVYWPSSIAMFGMESPKINTPQLAITDPNTVYGISKLAGELWCEYYFQHFGLDVRSLRYPGLIGYKSLPGGGTTDYAVDIYHKAVEGKHFKCFLEEDTTLPMMYMPDAIRATIELMEADANKISIHTSYNIQGMSFSPAEITQELHKFYPEFTISHHPDFRQQIAESWPQSMDDTPAQKDWGWKPNYDLSKMTEDMLMNLKELEGIKVLSPS